MWSKPSAVSDGLLKGGRQLVERARPWLHQRGPDAHGRNLAALSGVSQWPCRADAQGILRRPARRRIDAVETGRRPKATWCVWAPTLSAHGPRAPVDWWAGSDASEQCCSERNCRRDRHNQSPVRWATPAEDEPDARSHRRSRRLARLLPRRRPGGGATGRASSSACRLVRRAARSPAGMRPAESEGAITRRVVGRGRGGHRRVRCGRGG